jgi:hypothetical protein
MKTLLKFSLLCLATGLFAADVSITGLPAISTVSTSTVLPVVDVSGTPTTKKATVTQLINGLPVATGSTVGTMSAADKTKLDAATDANTASAIVRRDASGNFTAGTVTATTVTGLSSPTNPTDAANKSYVDASAAGLTVKQAARVATTANVTLSGGAPDVVDGVTLVANDRICVKNQSDQTENGIYYVATLGTGSNGTWTRTTDADTGAELATGTYIYIAAGTANINAAFTMVTQGTITIGTSNIVWALFSQVTSIAASSITGQLIQSQIQDAAINTAKFAAGLTPVEVLGTLPSSGNFAGRQVFLTTDSKLYRYTGSAFTTAVPAVDLTGQITTTQITDNAVSTAKINALAIDASKIATNAITAGKVAANAITAGTIAAGAVNTTELAADAVNSSKIAAGAVTASKITVADLSAISANIGNITAGTLTSVDLTASSGASQVSITTAGLVIGSGRITLAASGSNPTVRVYAVGGTDRIEINGNNTGGVPAVIQAYDGSANLGVTISSAGLFMTNAKPVSLGSGSRLQKSTSDSWTPKMFDGAHDLEFQWDGSDLKVRIDGSTVKTITTF